MPENTINQRNTLMNGFLTDISNICSYMCRLASDMENQSQLIYDDLYKTKKCDIQGDIDKYNNNLSNVKQLSSEMTMKMNNWYEFAVNINELGKISFPIRYYFRKKKLESFIKSTNKEIYNISIENRMIKERLTNWEHELEILTIQQIRQGNDYRTFTALGIKKDELISAVKYLLSTIPEACPAEIIVAGTI